MSEERGLAAVGRAVRTENLSVITVLTGKGLREDAAILLPSGLSSALNRRCGFVGEINEGVRTILRE
jgi:hypothetical protein